MLATLRNTAPERHTGIIVNTRQNKYGFIQTSDHASLFFHFSELNDEDKALVDTGCKVSFEIEPNLNSANNLKAVNVRIDDSKSTFKDIEGVVAIDMRTNGFCRIDANDSSYLFYSSNLVNDDACRAMGNTVREGQCVLFDIKLNYKYNPAKPHAVNVRVLMDGHSTAAHLAPKVTNSRASALCTGAYRRHCIRTARTISDAPSSPTSKPNGMSSSSLRVLVDAITRETQTLHGYLTVRNRLQSVDYLNRKLSIEEKRRLSALMNDMEGNKESTTKHTLRKPHREYPRCSPQTLHMCSPSAPFSHVYT